MDVSFCQQANARIDGSFTLRSFVNLRRCGSAGLLVRSFVNVLRYDSGFDASNILTGNTLIGGQPYDAQERHIRSFVDQLLPRLHALPGVEAAAVASALPLEPTFANSAITFEGVPLPPIGTWPTMLILRSLLIGR